MRCIEVFPGERALERAISALPNDGEALHVRLAAGDYREKITLTRPNTILEGAGAEKTRIVWNDAAFTLLQDGMKRGTFRTATLFVDAPRVTLRGLTIENDAAPREEVGQCIALYADGDLFTCEDCVLRSFQDTLFTAPLPPREVEKNGFIGPKQFAPRVAQRHTYRRCRIEGDVDFIFGGAAAWFEDCDIVSRDGRAERSGECLGYCTAASTPAGQAFGYVFSRCRFLAGGVPPQSSYLGRPWREYAKTVLLHCELGEHIRPEGWHDWNKPVFPQTGFYAEYGSTGPGAAGKRAPYARALTNAEAAAYTYDAFMASMPRNTP